MELCSPSVSGENVEVNSRQLNSMTQRLGESANLSVTQHSSIPEWIIQCEWGNACVNRPSYSHVRFMEEITNCSYIAAMCIMIRSHGGLCSLPLAVSLLLIPLTQRPIYFPLLSMSATPFSLALPPSHLSLPSMPVLPLPPNSDALVFFIYLYTYLMA